MDDNLAHIFFLNQRFMLNRVTIAASNCANAELSPVVFFVSVFIANTVGLYNI